MSAWMVCRLAAAVSLTGCLALTGGCGNDEAEQPARTGDELPPTASSGAGELWSEVTVPHLRATIRSISRAKRRRLAFDVHLEPVGKLGRVRVSRFAMAGAMGELVLRKQTGEPVRVSWHMSSLVQPQGVVEDYVIVPDTGLDVRVVPPGEGNILYWKPFKDSPSNLPAGTRLRYYLVSHAECASEALDKRFQLPVLGEGLVDFEG